MDVIDRLSNVFEKINGLLFLTFSRSSCCEPGDYNRILPNPPKAGVVGVFLYMIPSSTVTRIKHSSSSQSPDAVYTP